MKTLILYVILAVGSMSFLISCFDDEGNYTYGELTDFYVDTTGMRRSFSIPQFDTLRLKSKLQVGGDKSLLDFTWSAYPREWDFAHGIPADTLAKTEDIVAAVQLSSGEYYLQFSALDTRNGRRKTCRWNMTVESNTGVGMLVYYEKEGKVDCDMIKTPLMVASQVKDTVVRGVFSRVNDYQLKGRPLQAGVYGYYTTARYIYLLTDEDAVKLSTEDMRIMEHFEDMFYTAPEKVKPEHYFGPMRGVYDWSEPYEMIINNGQCHVDITAYAAGDPRFAAPLIGEYYAAPFVLMGWGGYIFLYDELQRRFLSCSVFDSQLFEVGPEPTLFDFKNIGKKMIFMDFGYGLCVNPQVQGCMAYAIFKNPVEDGKRYMYVMDLSESSHTKYVDRALIDLSGCEHIDRAELYTLGLRGPVAYYAVDNRIYQIKYDLDSDKASSVDAWPYIPAGEKITCLKLIKHAGLGLEDSALSKYLWVATYNESSGEGKVYLIATDVVNGVCEKEPLAVYRKFGKIKDIVFKFI